MTVAKIASKHKNKYKQIAHCYRDNINIITERVQQLHDVVCEKNKQINKLKDELRRIKAERKKDLATMNNVVNNIKQGDKETDSVRYIITSGQGA